MLKIALKAGPGKVNYDALALPFGATGSVAAFLRLAASIAFIGVKCLHLVWTVFFDDFTCVIPESLLNNTTTCAEGLFKLLGMTFAESGPKAPPFDVNFKTLGLQIDLSPWSGGEFILQHTDCRKLELVEVVKKILEKKLTTPKELERLHGRLVWFNAYIFGRRMNRAVSCVSKFARVRASSIKVEPDLTENLTFSCVKRWKTISPFALAGAFPLRVIFTDGAYEPSSSQPATIGGVLIHPCGGIVACLGEPLPEELTDQFVAESRHPIYELELFPVLISVVLWGASMASSHAVCYLDNDAARSSLIRAAGASELGSWLIELVVQFEMEHNLLPWFARVPSISNPANEVSRLDFSRELFRSVRRIRVKLPSHLKEWGIHGCSGIIDHSST